MIEFLSEEEYARDNQAAYHRLKPEIDANYPKDWFVGIYQGKIVADAESFEAVDLKLRERGVSVRDAFVVQAGENEDFLWIL